MWFAEIQGLSRIPLVSLVEATAEHVASRGLRRVALFGTRVTMEARFYPDELQRHGLETVLPNEEERTFIHEKYMGELFVGDIRSETRTGLLAIVDAMVAREAIDGVLLGGTELSLILTGDAHDGIPLIDTTRIHVDAVLARGRAS